MIAIKVYLCSNLFKNLKNEKYLGLWEEAVGEKVRVASDFFTTVKVFQLNRGQNLYHHFPF